ncbi:hypothetical protein CVT26_002258 [Gymnopilus dilepis]|uniref:Uncharacterized protein n=1 Tax=Gymnopilus dilepis TaxID=231916 RepID=A0A409YX12_9AGAR|nr:hypothetical protein CVT26_002258 [Gymnopilus dilepis]
MDVVANAAGLQPTILLQGRILAPRAVDRVIIFDGYEAASDDATVDEIFLYIRGFVDWSTMCIVEQTFDSFSQPAISRMCQISVPWPPARDLSGASSACAASYSWASSRLVHVVHFATAARPSTAYPHDADQEIALPRWLTGEKNLVSESEIPLCESWRVIEEYSDDRRAGSRITPLSTRQGRFEDCLPQRNPQHAVKAFKGTDRDVHLQTFVALSHVDLLFGTHLSSSLLFRSSFRHLLPAIHPLWDRLPQHKRLATPAFARSSNGSPALVPSAGGTRTDYLAPARSSWLTDTWEAAVGRLGAAIEGVFVRRLQSRLSVDLRYVRSLDTSRRFCCAPETSQGSPNLVLASSSQAAELPMSISSTNPIITASAGSRVAIAVSLDKTRARKRIVSELDRGCGGLDGGLVWQTAVLVDLQSVTLSPEYKQARIRRLLKHRRPLSSPSASRQRLQIVASPRVADPSSALRELSSCGTTASISLVKTKSLFAAIVDDQLPVFSQDPVGSRVLPASAVYDAKLKSTFKVSSRTGPSRCGPVQ